MGTVRNLIKGSFRLIRTHAQGETPSSNESNEALESLVLMLDEWAADGLLLPTRVREEFTLVSNQSRYSIGSGGDFDTTRPAEILDQKLEVQGDTGSEYPVRNATTKEWAAITNKGITSDIPYVMWLEGSAPLDYINLYPVPSSSTNKLVLYSKKPFATWTLDTVIQMPPGYEKLVKYGLAIELSPEYGKPVTAEVARGFTNAKRKIRRNNFESKKLDANAVKKEGKGFDRRHGE